MEEKIEITPGKLEEEPPEKVERLTQEEEKTLLEAVIKGEVVRPEGSPGEDTARPREDGAQRREDGETPREDGEEPREDGPSPETIPETVFAEARWSAGRKAGQRLFSDDEVRLMTARLEDLKKGERRRRHILFSRLSRWKRAEEEARGRKAEERGEEDRRRLEEEAKARAREEAERLLCDAMLSWVKGLSGAEPWILLDRALGGLLEAGAPRYLEELRLGTWEIEVLPGVRLSELQLLAEPTRRVVLKYVERYPNLLLWLARGGSYPEVMLLAAVAIVFGGKGWRAYRRAQSEAGAPVPSV